MVYIKVLVKVSNNDSKNETNLTHITIVEWHWLYKNPSDHKTTDKKKKKKDPALPHLPPPKIICFHCPTSYLKTGKGKELNIYLTTFQDKELQLIERFPL